MSSRNGDRKTVLNVSPSSAESAWERPGEESSPVTEPSLQETVETLFGLNERDVETLRAIQEEPGATTNDVAESVGRDRSNVNRSISLLEEIGLVTRRRRIMEAGGFFYEHYAESSEDIEALLTEAVEEWAERAVRTVADHDWPETEETESPPRI
ncbi:MAG: winged helix-turn-helix transcriptional regulator [Halobaculum sp.]